MEAIAIENLVHALQAVKKSQLNDLHILYDEAADVMYVNLGPPLPADDSELGDDNIIYRYKDNRIVGLTFTHFSERS